MTNDTNTLNGALTELGELMADNLVTMGVTDADASDGLTTLANKILDVPQGASTITVELATDKSVISYYDSETATLSATVKENNIVKSGVTVEFFMNGISMGTSTTNASGIATKTYNSIGVGTPSFTAIANNVGSESVTIEDIYKYYSGEQSNGTTYNLSLPNHFVFEVEVNKVVNQSSSASGGIVIGSLSNNQYINIGFGASANSKVWVYERRVAGQTAQNIQSDAISTNTWIAISVEVNQSNKTAILTVGSQTLTLSNIQVNIGTLDKVDTSSNAKFRNIKIKEVLSLSLTASASVLSYADSDSTTLTATHSKGSGKTVNLYDASDDSLIGAMTDNEDGTYSYTYNSQGIGDLTVYATDGNIESEEMLIEDCLDYDTLTSDNSKFTITGGVSATYNDTGLSVVGTSTANSYYMYQGTVPTNYIFECDVVSMTLGRYDASTELITSYCGISNISQTAGAKTRYGTFDTNYNFINYSDETRYNPPFHLKVQINNGNATYFIDNVQVHQRSCGQSNLGFKTYQNRGMVIKNMKLKPLGA